MDGCAHRRNAHLRGSGDDGGGDGLTSYAGLVHMRVDDGTSLQRLQLRAQGSGLRAQGARLGVGVSVGSGFGFGLVSVSGSGCSSCSCTQLHAARAYLATHLLTYLPTCLLLYCSACSCTKSASRVAKGAIAYDIVTYTHSYDRLLTARHAR